MSSATLYRVEWLERREQMRTGDDLKDIRPRLASRMRVSPGSLEGLRRKRVKDPKYSLVERVRAFFLRELEKEIAALTHEYQMAIQMGARADDEQVSEIETSLARLQGLIGEKKK